MCFKYGRIVKIVCAKNRSDASILQSILTGQSGTPSYEWFPDLLPSGIIIQIQAPVRVINALLGPDIFTKKANTK